MHKTELIRHTADKGILVMADTLAELFQGALEGMAKIQMPELPGRGKPHKETIDIEAPDKTALLIDFLSHVHTLSDIQNVIFTQLDIEELTERRLQGTVRGTGMEHFEEDIKAVTHSEAGIRKNERGKFETTVVFDI